MAKTTGARVRTSTNTGLCKLVPPSIVATALEESMSFPTTLTRGATTECGYRAEHSSKTAVIIRYDTDANAAGFVAHRTAFERHGLKLGPIIGMGDQAYYFADQSGRSTVTTVVVLKGSLQVLVTGTSALNPIGAIARFAMEQYASAHP